MVRPTSGFGTGPAWWLVIASSSDSGVDYGVVAVVVLMWSSLRKVVCGGLQVVVLVVAVEWISMPRFDPAGPVILL